MRQRHAINRNPGAQQTRGYATSKPELYIHVESNGEETEVSRTILCGSIHLSRIAYDGIQNRTMIEMFVSDENDDIVARPFSPRELFTAKSDDEDPGRTCNSYDAMAERWLFSCTLHEDDWFNANTEALQTLITAAKDRDGTDVVVALPNWSEKLDAAWVFKPGGGSAIEDPPALSEKLAQLLHDGRFQEALPQVRSLLAP